MKYKYASRTLAMLLALVLALACAAPAYAESTGTHTVEERSYKTYLGSSPDDTLNQEFPLYFADGVDDLPYVNIGDWVDLMNFYHTDAGDAGYALMIDSDNDVVTMTRENGYTMTIDYEKDKIVFTDYDAFYDARTSGKELDDTIGQIIEAHKQITREGSPIENVVLDMSCNTGGDVDAAVFVLGWFLGDAPFAVKNMGTGAMSNAIYRADVNLDGSFDRKDTVADKNLFCLISPVSFSCGNLVPAALKSSGRVTLLGQTSGGGSCIVQPMTTAYGTLFQISAPQRMSFLKNGSFYDIDQGIEPDIHISRLSSFYDRAALTDFINGLL